MLRYGLQHARCARGADECPYTSIANPLLFQQAPGFAVLFVFGARAVRGEEDVGLAVGGADGEDIPGVGGDDVGGDEVDVAWRVGDAVGIEVAFVGVAAMEDGALDLDAAEATAVVGGEVVRGGVSPGLGDAETEFGSAGHEAEFGPLAARFGVADGHSR
jgi:hypothetical protein